MPKIKSMFLASLAAKCVYVIYFWSKEKNRSGIGNFHEVFLKEEGGYPFYSFFFPFLQAGIQTWWVELEQSYCTMRCKLCIENSRGKAGDRISYDYEINKNTIDYLPRLVEKKEKHFCFFWAIVLTYFL